MGRQDSKDKYKLSAVDSIERLPLSEQVYLTLKTAILTGELMPQEKLNEVKIAEQLQVSATPVREAFRKLAKDNLVVIVPWKGVTVKADTPEEIIALYQVREVMEALVHDFVPVMPLMNKLKSCVKFVKKCMKLKKLQNALK